MSCFVEATGELPRHRGILANPIRSVKDSPAGRLAAVISLKRYLSLKMLRIVWIRCSHKRCDDLESD